MLAVLRVDSVLEAAHRDGGERRHDHVVESLDEQLKLGARRGRLFAQSVEDERLAQDRGSLGDGQRHLCAQVATFAREDTVDGSRARAQAR